MDKQEKVFSIEEASLQLKIPKHTLRFWEKELNGLLVPLRTNGGQRRYTVQNLFILEEIKRYRDNGMSLSEIVEKVSQSYGAEALHPSNIDLLVTRVAEVVKKEVYNFFRVGENDR
jgi:DNA-binding transcriptional MerR regulator